MANAISAFPRRISNEIEFDGEHVIVFQQIMAASTLSHCRISLKYNRKNVLGKGFYSNVFRGTYEDKKVAVKRIVLTSSLTMDECQHHEKLKHENVLKFLVFLDDSDFRYMVLDLCSGSLFQVIKKTYNGPPLPSDREVMHQIADGLNYVHSQNLIHFDIKPENILISFEGQMKLADFGLCKETTEGICVLDGPIRGTYGWMAPEVCRIIDTVSPKADLFSCGCVFFVFLSQKHGGIHPFGNRWESREGSVTTQSNIRNGERVNIQQVEHLPYANFILPLIENEPENRGSLEEFKNNLRDSAASSSILSNTNTPHQAQQEQTLARPPLAQEKLNPSFESHEMMEETNNQKKVPNNLVQVILPQPSRGSINGHPHNDPTEGDADEADSDGSVKIDTSNKSSGEESRETVGNDFEQEAEPGPSALSGCNSLPSTNGLVKPDLKQNVVTKDDYEEQEENKDVRKVSLNVLDEQETRDPRNLSIIKLNNTAKV